MESKSTNAPVSSRFRRDRYPAVRPIVDGDFDGDNSLADMVGEKVLSDVICGSIKAGSRIKSTELAQRLGVSRTPVAKALSRLATDGILEQPNNQQAIVSDGAADWLVQIHELRQLLEPEAAARSAGAMTADVLDDLWALAGDAEPTSESTWMEAAQYFDFALHLSVAEFCGNIPLKMAIRRCWTYKRLSYGLSQGCSAELKPEYDEHVLVLRALAAGDKQLARETMQRHLETASLGRFSNRIV